MKKLLLGLVLSLWATVALAQNPQCPTRPNADSSNACASTQFVHNVAMTGTGTVTSVGLSVPASTLFSVSGSPVTTSGTLALLMTGISGGIPYFSSTSQLNSSAILTANLPVFGGGAGTAPFVGTRSGNTTKVVTTTGTLTSGNCAQWDASGNIVQAAGPCGTSSGTSLTVGTTAIASGTTTKVLFDNSGILGEYTISGTGNVAMTTSPTLVTPALGVATATSINKVAITAPASGATLTIPNGVTMTGPAFSTTVAGLGVTNVFTGINQFSGLTAIQAGLTVPIRVITVAGSVTVAAASDYFICVNKTVGAATSVNLPSGNTGQTFLVKDCKGDAATNPITVIPASGTIDGAATYVLNTNRASAAVTFDGSNWQIN